MLLRREKTTLYFDDFFLLRGTKVRYFLIHDYLGKARR